MNEDTFNNTPKSSIHLTYIRVVAVLPLTVAHHEVFMMRYHHEVFVFTFDIEPSERSE